MLSLPPLLVTGHGSVSPNNPSHLPLSARGTVDIHSGTIIACYFYPRYDSVCAQEWRGPDLLSPSTRTEDVFLSLPASQLPKKLDWADIRICVLDHEADEMVAVYPFFLPRTESMLRSLPRVCNLVQDVVASHDVEKFRFRLSIRLRNQQEPNSVNVKTAFRSYIRPKVPVLPLDP
jgi:hypothetical protein